MTRRLLFLAGLTVYLLTVGAAFVWWPPVSMPVRTVEAPEPEVSCEGL